MSKASDSAAAGVGLLTDTASASKQVDNTKSARDVIDAEDDFWVDAKEEHENFTSATNPVQVSASIEQEMISGKLKFNNSPDATTAASSSSTSCCSSNQSTNPDARKDPLSPSNDGSNLALNEAVFKDDLNKVYELLSDKELAKSLVNKKDKHGNTPLHLACMLGRSKEMISVLLHSGASVDCKNLNRWTPFHEACSYGNREVITLMTQQLKDDVYDALSKHRLSESLAKTKNYRLALKWEFQSWLPFISRFLPSDVCIIHKQGKYIRIDTNLLNFETLSWKKSEGGSLIYSDKFEKKWIIMSRKEKKFQHFEAPDYGKHIEDKVDEFMSTDIMDIELRTNNMLLSRSVGGWLFKADRYEKIGRYNAALYEFRGVSLVTRKRREHLTEEEVKRNKVAYRSVRNFLKFGKKPPRGELEDMMTASEPEDGEDTNDSRSDGGETEEQRVIQHRKSLPPPNPKNVTWEQYCRSEPPGNHPTLGRDQKCKTSEVPFKASVAMSDDFPLNKEELMNLLSITPLKLFKKLKEFIEMKLPDGFPISLDIPLFPGFLSAVITFEDFAFVDGPVDESLFSIPSDYEEDPSLFPLLSGKSRNTNRQ